MVKEIPVLNIHYKEEKENIVDVDIYLKYPPK